LQELKETVTEGFEAPTAPLAATGGALKGLPEPYSAYDLRVASYWERFYPHRRCLQQL